MAKGNAHDHLILTLATKLEDEFVSPMTAIRSTLEILRDYADLPDEERRRIVNTAISECARLEHGVSGLADAVYADADSGDNDSSSKLRDSVEFLQRIVFSETDDVVHVDFSDIQFKDPRSVNAVYDAIDSAVEATGRKWYFVLNLKNFKVWPEAWIAYAHRGKKVRVNYAKDVFRYEEGALEADESHFPSREAAMQKVQQVRAAN